MNVALRDGQWTVGDYSIAGNRDDGYTIWRTRGGEDSETLFASEDFESCMTWCWNSWKEASDMTNLELIQGMGPMNLAEFIFLVSCDIIKGARKCGDRNISICTISDWEAWLAQPAKYTDRTPPRFWRGV